LFTYQIKEFFDWLIDHYIDTLAENMELRKLLEEANEKIKTLTNLD
jgi:cell division septum initiation protein DivIVA